MGGSITQNDVDDTTQVVKPADTVRSDTNKTDMSGSDTKKTESVPLATLLATKEKLKEAEGRLKAIEDANKIAEQEKLKKNGEFEKLLADKEKEIESLKPEAEQAREYRAVIVEELKEKMGEKWKDEYGLKLSLPALQDLSKSFDTSKSITTDNGDGTVRGEVRLSDKEEEKRIQMGLSKEGYLQFRKRQKELKGEE